jgi:hypothetical protein
MLAAPPTDPEAATSLAVAEEILVPEQFFTSSAHSQVSWTPERRLLLAVLEDAAAMFIRYCNDHTTRGKRLFRETREWFASTDRTSLCAFETICDYLNLDAEYIRLGLRWLLTANAARAAITQALAPASAGQASFGDCSRAGALVTSKFYRGGAT